MIGNAHMGIGVEQLNALGNPWTKKNGEARWYVNDWQEMIGMEVVYYNTGNVSDVYYHGGNGWHGEDHPSNSWYYKNVAGTKVWIDAEGRVHVDHCKDAGVEKDIIAKLEERIEALMPRVEEMAVSFAAEPEEPEVIDYYIQRKADGALARVRIEGAPETDDPWQPLEAMPRTYDKLDESMIVDIVRADEDGKWLDYDWESGFSVEGDAACAEWLTELETDGHYEGDLDDDHGCAVSIKADRTDGFATVTWTPADGSAPRAMDIYLHAGDFYRITLGADPVAEHWEDRMWRGHLVCWDNAQEVERCRHSATRATPGPWPSDPTRAGFTSPTGSAMGRSR